MRCKIVKTQKLMWRNIMRLIKSQKVLILHYSIDNGFIINYVKSFRILFFFFMDKI